MDPPRRGPRRARAPQRPRRAVLVDPSTPNASPTQGAVASVGSKGDSYDNAMAESINGLYKSELIYNETQGPWRTVEDVELATLGWVHWWNTQPDPARPIGDIPPVEFEQRWREANSSATLSGAPERLDRRGWHDHPRRSTPRRTPRRGHHTMTKSPSNPGRFSSVRGSHRDVALRPLRCRGGTSTRWP